MRLGVGILTLSVGITLLECVVLALVVSCNDTTYCTTSHLPYVFNAYYRILEGAGCDSDSPDATLRAQCQCQKYWSRRGLAADVVRQFSDYEG